MDEMKEEVVQRKGSKYFPEVGENFDEEVKYNHDINVVNKHYSLFKEHVGIEPIDGGDPDIYSKVESVGPFSFVNIRQDYDEECPPPTYFEYKDVHLKLPIEKNEIFEKFEF